MQSNIKLLPAEKLLSLRFLSTVLFTIPIFIFSHTSFAQPVSDTEYYRAPFSAVTPTIDGIANEEIWQDATWVPIAQLYLGTAPSAADFTGRYKIVWTSSRLYVLTEVTDNLLSDDHPDPLTNWWDDDCVEIFLDENKSGGNHQFNYNAFAYHVAALDYHVVDIGIDQNPHLYDDHITTKWTKTGNVYTWEMEIKEFPDTFVYGGTNQPVTLTLGKKSGFNIAYCDNDETTSRESFIGSRFLQPADRDRGYIDASTFATIELVNSTAKRIKSFNFNSPVATGVITGNNIAVSVPASTNVTNLLASFMNSLSSSVKVGTTPQVSGSTVNSFTNPVTYTVTAQDGSTANYTVTVTVQSSATNIALGKTVKASSAETTAVVAANAVDGNTTTRWSSQFSDPQWIYVDLGGSYSINRVNLIWEGAYGKDYKIQTSPDAATWTDIKTVTGNTSLSNDWTGLSGTGKYVRIYGTARGTVYGYSLFEMQVYGTPVNTDNIAKGKPAVASSAETAATSAANAVDGVSTTRWSSLFSDPQWIYVDLGGNYAVNRVKLVWEGAYGKDYKVQISTSTSGPWTDIKTVTGNTTLTNDWTGLSGTGRYVRVSGTARGTAYGYSLYEFEVYGTFSSARIISDNTQTPDHEEKFYLYPNPASENIRIERTWSEDEFVHAKVFSLQGALLKTMLIKNGDALNIADLPKGNYLLMLGAGKNTATKIFIKE